MFSVVYAFLGAVWVFVVNDKIQHGPELSHDYAVPDGTISGDRLLDVAARMFKHGRYSLTNTPSTGSLDRAVTVTDDANKAGEGKNAP